MSIIFGYGGLFKEVTRHQILNTRTGIDGKLFTAQGYGFSERVSPDILDN